MNCNDSEKLVALYVEGDLGDRETRSLQEHLRECPACRELASELAGSQAALKELRNETVDRAVLAQVRANVMVQVEGRRPSLVYGWRWRYGLIVSVMALLAGVAVWLHPRRDTTSRSTVAESPTSVKPPAQRTAPELDVRRLPQPHARQQRARRPASRLASPGPQESTADFELPKIELPRIEPVRIDPPESPDQLKVKLLTDDPEVVIVWLIDQNGERNEKAN